MTSTLAQDNAATFDLDALRRQEAGVFEQLVLNHQRLVMGLGQSLGLEGADLDDAAAETFAAVYQALPRFRAEAGLGTWIYRIAWRTMLKARHRRRRLRLEPLPDNLPDANVRPDAAPQERESNEALWRAVSALPPKQAMAVELHYRRDWPVDRIAAVMQCPEGTVKTLLFRARGRLREKLDKEMRP
jgi:RNA polymerase sigma-70 factor (ECF subfamily)